LLSLLPLLQHLQEQASAHLKGEGDHLRDAVEHSKQMLQRLQELSQGSPETVLHAGDDLHRAVIAFARVPNVPAATLTSLNALAERIPVSLRYAQAELESVQCWLPAQASTIFYEQLATRENFWNALAQATIAHCACHGKFDAEMPLNSSLLLGGESELTLRDVLNAEPVYLARLHLVILSACQTAITDIRRLPDEAVGLFAGFLQAGVPSVLGTLWAVDDVSTALLMTRFYELYLRGEDRRGLPPQSPVRALRAAQYWMRTLTNRDLYAYLQYLAQPDLFPGPQRPVKLVTELLPLVRRALRQGQADAYPYARLYNWGAFAYYGAM
jgi:CHAT domain-containing protein